MSSPIENSYIVYPDGCQPVSPNLSRTELLQQLTKLATSFQTMSQEIELKEKERLSPLSFYLLNDFFLEHEDREVQLLTACCIVDVFRVFAPSPPYKNEETLKTALNFLIDQIAGLEREGDPGFVRQFYLLENLTVIQSFNVCLRLDDSIGILVKVFETMFRITRTHHEPRVLRLMTAFLSPLIEESDLIHAPLLNAILTPIMEPAQSENPQAYSVATDVIRATAEHLEPSIQVFFNRIIVMKEQMQELLIGRKPNKLVEQLYRIKPALLQGVLPDYIIRLQSSEDSERMGAIKLLGKIFAERGSTLAVADPCLWEAFLRRFNDTSVRIRVYCMELVEDLILHHPEVRRNLFETLNDQLMDCEEVVRLAHAKSIIKIGKKDFYILANNETLLSQLRVRTQDLKFCVRKESLQGCGQLYSNTLKTIFERENPVSSEAPVQVISEEVKKGMLKLGDTILSAYAQEGVENKHLVERLFNLHLVPYSLSPGKKMERLLFLFCRFTSGAASNFKSLQRQHRLMSDQLAELFNLSKVADQVYQRELPLITERLAQFLADKIHAPSILAKLCREIKVNTAVAKAVRTIVNPETSCSDIVENTNAVLSRFGDRTSTDRAYLLLKVIFERSARVLMDRSCAEKLVDLLHGVASGSPELLEKLGLDWRVGLERGIDLLRILVIVYPNQFGGEACALMLVGLLDYLPENLKPELLTILTVIGRKHPISAYRDQTRLNDFLLPTCQAMILTGRGAEAKAAVRYLGANMMKQARAGYFKSLLPLLGACLKPGNANCRTAVVALGHIAYQFAARFKDEIRVLMKRVVKGFVLHFDRFEARTSFGSWCELEELPEATKILLAAIKALVRWAMGLRNDIPTVLTIIKLLISFIDENFFRQTDPFSNAEKSHLRIGAGTALLLLCRSNFCGDYLTPEQISRLSTLMVDEVPEVRHKFVKKLFLGLNRGSFVSWYPSEFFGMVALGGYETDRTVKSWLRKTFADTLETRIKAAKEVKMTGSPEDVRSCLPENLLMFAIPYLSVHNPHFTDLKDVKQLTGVKTCLSFVLEPIIKSGCSSYGFLKHMFEGIKRTSTLIIPDADDEINSRIYATCDLALLILDEKSTGRDMNYDPKSIAIPKYFWKILDTPNQNPHLPSEMYTPKVKRVKI